LGYGCVAGVDEAGRGPLAGPVVAAAVILPPGVALEGVRDSKQMRPRAREKAFEAICRSCAAASVGVVSHRYIDAHNILAAALEAMRRAVLGLGLRPDYLLVDGNQPVPLAQAQECVVKGDQKSRSVAAASVLAKVYRDRIMRAYHGMFPQYGFDRNMGYGTQEHLAALARYGATPLHRRTFKGVTGCDPGASRSRQTR